MFVLDKQYSFTQYYSYNGLLPITSREEIMHAWTIIVHEDSTGRREKILICSDAPYVDMSTNLHPERISAPEGKIVALAGYRVAVYSSEKTAKTKERDASTRLFDDQGNRL